MSNRMDEPDSTKTKFCRFRRCAIVLVSPSVHRPSRCSHSWRRGSNRSASPGPCCEGPFAECPSWWHSRYVEFCPSPSKSSLWKMAHTNTKHVREKKTFLFQRKLSFFISRKLSFFSQHKFKLGLSMSTSLKATAIGHDVKTFARRK